MTDPFPHYDVLDKHDTPSWNDKSREVIDRRLSLREENAAFDATQMATLRRLVPRIAPQPERRPPANTVAILIRKIAANSGDGFRPPDLPQVRECWQRGLDAIQAEAMVRHDRAFAELDDDAADSLLRLIERGDAAADAWVGVPPQQFWKWRVLPDVLSAHWAHPSLWSAIGFGGPASPRGYVRLNANRRDGWEAKEEPRG